MTPLVMHLWEADSFPVVAASTSSRMTDQVTSHTVSLPSGIVDGSLVVVYWANASETLTVTFPAGWSLIYGATGIFQLYARVCDGTEGASITVTTSGSRRSAHVAVRYSGQNATSPFEGAGATDAPPALSPAWGSAPNAWSTSAAGGCDASGFTWTAPTNYTGLIQVETYLDAGTAHCTLGVAFRDLAAASETPGAWTNALAPTLTRFTTGAVRAT